LRHVSEVKLVGITRHLNLDQVNWLARFDFVNADNGYCV
jgi:hypothetical protein